MTSERNKWHDSGINEDFLLTSIFTLDSVRQFYKRLLILVQAEKQVKKHQNCRLLVNWTRKSTRQEYGVFGRLSSNLEAQSLRTLLRT